MGPLQYYLNGTQFKWASYNNIDPESPGPLDLIFANQFKWATNNNIDPGSPGPFNLISFKEFKWAPTIIFKWPLIQMGLLQ